MRRFVVMIAFGLMIMGLAPAVQAAQNPPKFKTACKPSHLAQEDPIVAPGTMSAHMHDFIGNTTTNKDSTYASMVAGDSTCSAVADTAGYWIPTLIDSNGQTHRPKGLTIYYRGGPNGEHVTPFPPDFRVVTPVTVAAPVPDTIIVKFPQCWDGDRADSADHYSHMAWAGGKVGGGAETCPASHPVRVPAISLNMRYGTQIAGKTLSSGALSTMHADFWNTWQQNGFEALVDRCLNEGAGVDCGAIKDK